MNQDQEKPDQSREKHEEMDVMNHLRHSVLTLERIEARIAKMVGPGSDLEQLKTMVGSCYDAVNSMSEDMANKLSSILSAQQEQGKALADIQLTLGSRKSLQIQFEGESPMTPGQMNDTQTIQATEIETDAAGQPVTITPGNVAWGIDDPTIAQLTQNADGSATFKALKPGTATISCTDNGQTPPVVGTNSLSVTTAGPNTLTISFGDPQSPTPPAPAPAGQ